MPADILTDRQLNRATLARQFLLERSLLPVARVVERLVGLQAQEQQDPYTGLWSRVEGFEPEHLADLLVARRVVRLPLMRSTIHLVTARDCLGLRPLVQPVLDGELKRHAQYGPLLKGIDLRPVLTFARRLFAKRPLTGPELRKALGTRFPQHDPAALAYACRNHLALVQVPPRGLWKQSAQVTTTTAEAWLGKPVTPMTLDKMVLRFLAAFGPATAADVAAWSRLTGFAEVIDRLRRKLRMFRDEKGRELFDLPDAPHPDPDTPAPPRFLPTYDNLLLSHADRSRFFGDRKQGLVEGRITGSVLEDGVTAGVWRIDRERDRAVLKVQLTRQLSKRALASVIAEGRRYLAFAMPEAAEREVRA